MIIIIVDIILYLLREQKKNGRQFYPKEKKLSFQCNAMQFDAMENAKEKKNQSKISCGHD